MRRHTQTILHVPGESVGDCWRTAIACLLDLDEPTQVPHFVADYPEEGPGWWYASVEFVERNMPGWTLENYDAQFPAYLEPEQAPQFVIVSGRSPRGVPHAVIADAVTGEIVWDPHPDRTGLVGHPTSMQVFIGRGAS